MAILTNRRFQHLPIKTSYFTDPVGDLLWTLSCSNNGNGKKVSLLEKSVEALAYNKLSKPNKSLSSYVYFKYKFIAMNFHQFFK